MFYAQYPPSGSGSGSGVTSLNGLTGALTLVAGSGITITPSGSNITISATGGGSGTVTSVALADGSSTPIYSISGSPVTTSGTLAFTLMNQTANTVFAGPSSGGSAQPSFRALVTADIPSLNYANQALSNLTTTSINTSLIPGVSNSIDLGSPSVIWSRLFINQIGNTAQQNLINIGNQRLNDTSNNTSVDWALRHLSNGTTTVLDFSGTDPSLNTHKLTNVVDPTNPQDAATKAYVDAQVASGSQIVETRTITSGEETAKAIVLTSAPTVPADTILDVQSAPAQMYTSDYTVSGSTLSWSGLGLDGLLNAGDIVRILYWV